jgi:hypothetical protein
MAAASANLSSSSALTADTVLATAVFAAEVGTPAIRTPFRTSAAKRQFPRMLTVLALELPHFIHLDFTSFYSQYSAQNECLGSFPSRAVDDPAKRLTRHVHRCRSLFMVKTIQVRQAQRLKLVQRQHNLFQKPPGNARWLEHCARRFLANSTTALRARHMRFPFHLPALLWAYAHNMSSSPVCSGTHSERTGGTARNHKVFSPQSLEEQEFGCGYAPYGTVSQYG